MVKLMSYKSIFTIVAARHWEIEQIDVQTALFYRNMEEKFLVQQSTGFKDAILPNYSCLVKKTLYDTG